jgi:hypothetical protein
MSDARTSEIDRLSVEHTVLTRQQYDALQKSSYARMPKAEADAYDERFFRIIEIRRRLTQFRTEDSAAHQPAIGTSARSK